MRASTTIKKNGRVVEPAATTRTATVDVPRINVPLFGKMPFGGDGDSRMSLVAKLALPGSDEIDEALPSAQSVDTGDKEHPFDMDSIGRLMVANTHHSACILTKRDATTGLGFKADKVADLLDPLTAGSFLDLLNVVGEDYWQTGNGYMEVVRGSSGAIEGLHHIPAPQVVVHVEDSKTYDYHYVIRSREGAQVRFARFGDKTDMLSRQRRSIRPERVSEVIHFKQPSALSRWYGVPNWLSSVACIELVMAILQHNYDFFNNRGVPEFLCFLLGAKVQDSDFEAIKNGLKQQIGLGNGFKSMVINLADPNLKVDLQKLNVDGGNTEAAFQKFLDTLALMIVSGHRVPPLLAGIQIPGKLGANNELPNAMAGFQALVIGPAQATFAHTLGTTLGHPKLGVRQGLRGRKSFELNTILDHINVQQMAATASTRKPVGPAQDKSNQGDKPSAPKPAPAKTVKALKARIVKAEKLLKDSVREWRKKAVAV